MQGFVAGVNAALKLKGEDPMILRRSDGYIGTLIDDLVTKGTNEPYRMMTSRSEYRLLHRQDNADKRLCGIGLRIGLVSQERYDAVQEKYAAVEREIRRLEKTHIAPSDKLNAYLEANGTAPVVSGASLADLIRRPQLSYEGLAPFDAQRPELARPVWYQAEISLKYEGYIKRQLKQVEDFPAWKTDCCRMILITTRSPVCALKRARSLKRSVRTPSVRQAASPAYPLPIFRC